VRVSFALAVLFPGVALVPRLSLVFLGEVAGGVGLEHAGWTAQSSAGRLVKRLTLGDP